MTETTHLLAPMHRARLDEMATLTDGWCPGGTAPTPAALTAVERLLTRLPLPLQARFEVYPTVEGGVTGQWVERRLVCTVDLAPDGAATGRLFDGDTDIRTDHAWDDPAEAAQTLLTARATRAPAADEPDPAAVRHVGLFCDRGCGAVIEEQVLATVSAEEAYTVLRSLAAGRGWRITPDEDVCPACCGPCTAYREYGYQCGLPAGHDPDQEHVNVRETPDGQ